MVNVRLGSAQRAGRLPFTGAGVVYAMDRDWIVFALQRHAPELRRLGAANLFMFGSAARDEMTTSSDVDLFFDYDDPSFSLIELVALQDRISDIVETRADLMSRGGIHPHLRQSIEGSAIRVF